MRLQLLKSIIIYTFSLLATGSCLSLGLWRNKNSHMAIIQPPLHIGLRLRSSTSVLNISGFLGRQHDTNYLEESVNRLNENWIKENIKNNNVKEFEDDVIYTLKGHYEDNSATNKNHKKITKYFTTTDKAISDSKTNNIDTQESTETTTEFTTEIYSTEDYEFTTSDGILSRSALSSNIIASLLG